MPTNYPIPRHIFVSKNGRDNKSGRDWGSSKLTIGAAVTLADADADIISVGPGGYNETVLVEATENAVRIVGDAGLGSAYIEPETAGAEGMTVLADDVSIENIGVAADDTGSYSLKVGSQTVSPARFRAKKCKFESKMVLLQGVGDTLFEDCEFAWMDEDAVQFAANDNGFCTQVTFRRCHFHNITRDAFAKAVAGGVRNLKLEDCTFDNAEDGTAPAHYINLPGNDETGLITGCVFATPTNEADLITIGDKILYVANATEAGITSARPS